MSNKSKKGVRPWRGEPIKNQGFRSGYECFGSNHKETYEETHCKICGKERPNWSNYQFFGETFIAEDGLEYFTMREAFCDDHVPKSWKDRDEREFPKRSK